MKRLLAQLEARRPEGVLWREDWRNLSGWICVDAGGGFGNQELQYYSPANARAEAGELVITATARGNAYTSGKLFCRRALGRESGYLEFETRCFPQTAGLWPALWLLPTDGTETLVDGLTWPAGGEVDLIESFGAQADAIHAAHWGTYEPQDGGKHHTYTSQLPELPRRPHRIGLGFSGYSLTWYVDRRPVSSVTVPSPPFVSLARFAPIVNLAMGGTLTGHVAPAEGAHELRLGPVALYADPPGGWPAFGEAHARAQRGGR